MEASVRGSKIIPKRDNHLHDSSIRRAVAALTVSSSMNKFQTRNAIEMASKQA